MRIAAFPPDFYLKKLKLAPVIHLVRSVSLRRGASAFRLEIRDGAEDESELRSEKRLDKW
jgi:hypothetical protein